MPTLKLSDWANLSEIVASVAVVLSLIYVGFQINQNTVAIQQESHQSVQEILQAIDLTLAADPELLKIVMSAEKSPAEVTELQWRRFTHMAIQNIATWEFVYLARSEGAITEDQWAGFNPYFTAMVCKAGYRRFWEENRPFFTPSFALHVNTIIGSECVVSS